MTTFDRDFFLEDEDAKAEIREQELEMLANLIEAEGDQAKKYHMKSRYEQFDLIDHPKFGLGFVKDFLGRDKMLVFFADKERIMLMNFKLVA